MTPIMIFLGSKAYFCLVNSMYVASVFSVLTFIASAGIILFMRAVRLSKKNAIKHGLYLILVSFILGIILMGLVINMG